MRPRPLRGDEIRTLRGNGCAAENWDNVSVAGAFSAGSIRNAEFSGAVTIGANCRIANAALADIDIGDNVLIQNVAFIGQTSVSSFGNGSPIHCIAEDGARSVPLWRGLSAQWAHLLLHCKGTEPGRALERLIAADAASLASERSHIGDNCRITFSGMLRNVRLGAGTIVESAAALRDVYTESSPEAPVFLGVGVSAEDCVFQRLARVNGGSRLVHCFVGEGVTIDHAFFAKHSLFFANSEFTLGESACAVSGPFAVSHHRATLVLTCQNSFGTFGSGANSSNHHFKLGPRHGGVLRRGTRCGSGSYLFWPADIGAFTTVVGKHARSLDTAAFPFSLLTAEGDRSILVPGVNLFSAGLFRDERKWRGRDKRGGITQPRDLCEAAVFSPYTMEAAERGLSLLRAHAANGGGDVFHNGAVIPAGRVAAAIRLYETALIRYMGRVLVENKDSESAPDSETSCDDWRDWGGLPVSGGRAEAFLRNVPEDAAGVDAAFRRMRAAYKHDELRWVKSRWRAEFAAQWREAVEFAFARQMRDISKEFTEDAVYGFGVEGDARENFLRLRGLPEDDEVAVLMREERDRLLGSAHFL